MGDIKTVLSFQFSVLSWLNLLMVSGYEKV